LGGSQSLKGASDSEPKGRCHVVEARRSARLERPVGRFLNEGGERGGGEYVPGRAELISKIHRGEGGDVMGSAWCFRKHKPEAWDKLGRKEKRGKLANRAGVPGISEPTMGGKLDVVGKLFRAGLIGDYITSRKE